ncbi:MAG TPA: 16S rRNA (adenine(1518)-N(6)/adenine(1519)-N(6))-dimethyltransferase RsmA [Steroidobacteraceae bacterium]|nr:16S rRNA (adenine(1518)-N(6)/adenine(1519)-N(6))-dimethyltransferase RsmA [Steroidobacteraceae bacterium]
MSPARKRFGQHFLHDPGVIGRIARAIDAGPTDHLLEIGPGRGALTHVLLEGAYATFDAVEIDRDLAGQLRPLLALARGATLHEGDALEFDFAKLAQQRGGRLRVIGNLPYNISTPLLFRLIAAAPAILDLHVMLQREVVARMAAAPGTTDYGRLTVMLAPWVSVEQLFDIGPGAFKPPPRVWSAVARLRVREQPAFAVAPQFAQVVTAAFSQRRKTLRNALRGLLAAADIEACGVDPAARAETVAPEAFNRLALRIAPRSVNLRSVDQEVP